MTDDFTPAFDAASLLDFMRTHDVQFRHYHHVPVFTVAEADDVSANIPGLHTRNMFLKDKKDRMVLVTLAHDFPIDLKRLSDVLGMGRFSFGSPERLWTHLGVRPGSVTPLSALNDCGHQVRVVLEASMMAAPLINVHPLVNSMTVGLAPQDLVTLLEKQGKTPEIIDLKTAQPVAAPAI